MYDVSAQGVDECMITVLLLFIIVINGASGSDKISRPAAQSHEDKEAYSSK